MPSKPFIGSLVTTKFACPRVALPILICTFLAIPLRVTLFPPKVDTVILGTCNFTPGATTSSCNIFTDDPVSTRKVRGLSEIEAFKLTTGNSAASWGFCDSSEHFFFESHSATSFLAHPHTDLRPLEIPQPRADTVRNPGDQTSLVLPRVERVDTHQW